METFAIEDLSFFYPDSGTPALRDINLTIPEGQFVTLCGISGSGKTTLLRHLKSVLAPHGLSRGRVLFEGHPLQEMEWRLQTARIGFVMQNPDNQIVTDKVWHELAFGLESLGCDSASIRLRVAEMASFFGIQTWFHRKVSELSGGQKQLLNLAAIMAMQPRVLVLDEPSSQLDPIAATDFLAAVRRINQELGVTVIISEHRLEEVFPMSDRVVVMDEGSIVADGPPRQVGMTLKQRHHRMFTAMPAPMRIYAAVENDLDCPVTVREGRSWLDQLAVQGLVRAPEAGWPERYRSSGIQEPRPLAFHLATKVMRPDNEARSPRSPLIELKGVWFKYNRDAEDVIKDLSLNIYPGEFIALTGGNGTGKTTALSLIAGINRPYRGSVQIDGIEASQMPLAERFGSLLGCLPQNPQALFVKKSVAADLYEMLSDRQLDKEEQEYRFNRVVKQCRLESLLAAHPYDLSLGEQQRAALAKVLLLEPKILLLDEPTKGIDGEFKEELAAVLHDLVASGVTIVMVSHDIEFCARYTSRCALLFDGSIVCDDQPRAFFGGNSFYTTAANRMARHLLPDAITAEDIISACGGRILPRPAAIPGRKRQLPALNRKSKSGTEAGDDMVPGIAGAGGAHFVLDHSLAAGVSTGAEAAFTGAVWGRLPPRTLAALLIIALAIPLTVYFGMYHLGDRKYYFISLLVVLETMLPFLLVFEGRRPQARELVIIAVLCAIGVAGRAAFFMLPQFKPVIAIVVIAGVCLGGEAGFLVGAMTAFVSDCFFGQGPWTPWQMFCLGIIGFLAGILFKKGLLPRGKLPLCIFGALAALVIYGGLMNPAAVLIFQPHPTVEMFWLAYLQGAPFDLVHAAATAFFLFVMAKPMLEKLDRIKKKYGLIEP